MPKVIVFPGEAAYSPFKLHAYARALQAEDVTATFQYLVALKNVRSIDDVSLAEGLDVQKLQTLLCSGEPIVPSSDSDDESCHELFVAPRTLSPWSSKATNIAHVCGLGNWVQRIERILVVKISSSRAIDLLEAFNLFHDRMTQTITTVWPDMDALFAEVAPSPAKAINLKDQGLSGREVLQRANKDMGLALDDSEIDYLIAAYAEGGSLARDPNDVELFMFAQVRIRKDTCYRC